MDEYRFNLEDWMSVLRPNEFLESGRQGFAITGPHHILRLEECRTRAAARCDLGPSVPADVFVLGLGKSPKRAMSKIGGVPHRPPGLPWPTQPDGKPMTFLAQYRFAESRDLLGDLPGDILLVFIRDHELSHRSPQDFFRFEWHPLQWDEPDEIEYVPCPEWEFVNCYGVRHRTVDYVQDVPEEVFREVVPKAGYSEYRLHDCIAELSRNRAMKIGGLPTLAYEEEQAAKIPDGSRLLCSLTYVYATPGVSYPWENIAGPLSLRSRGPWLDFCDGFLLDFWITKDRDIVWVNQFA